MGRASCFLLRFALGEREDDAVAVGLRGCWEVTQARKIFFANGQDLQDSVLRLCGRALNGRVE